MYGDITWGRSFVEEGPGSSSEVYHNFIYLLEELKIGKIADVWTSGGNANFPDDPKATHTIEVEFK